MWKERCTTTLVVSIEYPASQLDVFASIVTSARPNGPFGRRVLETIGFLYLLYRPPNSPYRSYKECIIAFSPLTTRFQKILHSFFFSRASEHRFSGDVFLSRPFLIDYADPFESMPRKISTRRTIPQIYITLIF